MHSEITGRAERAIRERVFPGCVIGIVNARGEREVLPFGRFTYDSDAPAVGEDTIYDLASVTKSIPVASLASVLIDEGKFKLTDSVKEYIPELQNDYGATIEDLLTYRVCGPRLSELKDKLADAILEYVFENGLTRPSAPVYTNLPALLLGIVIERIAMEPLVALAQKRFFGPLDMKDTTFFPRDIARVAPTEISENETVIRGIVHDESAYVFAKAGRAVGHAGLFSTVPDILNFLEVLLQGKYPSVVDGAQRGLGWQVSAPWFMGKLASRHAFGKTGFTGTSVVCDVERGIAFVILSNRTYPKRPPDAISIHSAINVFRADIADIILR